MSQYTTTLHSYSNTCLSVSPAKSGPSSSCSSPLHFCLGPSPFAVVHSKVNYFHVKLSEGLFWRRMRSFRCAFIIKSNTLAAVDIPLNSSSASNGEEQTSNVQRWRRSYRRQWNIIVKATWFLRKRMPRLLQGHYEVCGALEWVWGQRAQMMPNEMWVHDYIAFLCCKLIFCFRLFKAYDLIG